MRYFFIFLTAFLISLIVLIKSDLFSNWFSLEIFDWAIYFFIVPLGYSLINIFKPIRPNSSLFLFILGAFIVIFLDRGFDNTLIIKKSLAASSGAFLIWLLSILIKKIRKDIIS